MVRAVGDLAALPALILSAGLVSLLFSEHLLQELVVLINSEAISEADVLAVSEPGGSVEILRPLDSLFNSHVVTK